MISDGEVLLEEKTQIVYLPAPDGAQWEAAMVDADETRKRTLYLYGRERMQELVNLGKLAIYEISQGQTRLGSMALEKVVWNNKAVINVVWLRLQPGTFSNGVKEAVRQSWRAVAAGFQNPLFTIQGRPGWESVLIERGFEPKHLSSLWVFDSERL